MKVQKWSRRGPERNSTDAKTKSKKATRREPTYLIDSTKGRAFTWHYEPGTSQRKKIALGPAESPESHREFAKVKEIWKARLKSAPPPPPAEVDISIDELCARFLH